MCNGSRKSPPQPEAKMRFLHPAGQILACSTSRDVNKPSRYSAFSGKSALGPRSVRSRFFQSIHHKHRFRATCRFLCSRVFHFFDQEKPTERNRLAIWSIFWKNRMDGAIGFSCRKEQAWSLHAVSCKNLNHTV